MILTLITPPAALPLDLAAVRAHVRQSLIVDDALLTAYLRGAVGGAEQRTQRAFVARRYQLTLDAWPGYTYDGMVPFGRAFSQIPSAVNLQRGAVLGVQSVKYTDMSGTVQTLSPGTDYVASLAGTTPRLTPPFGKVWPANTLPQVGAVQIVYDVGDLAAITAAGNVLTIKGGIWKTLAVGDALRLTNSGGALPAPLQPDTDYFVQSLPTASSFTVAATAGGAVITLTDTGTGTHYIGELAPEVASWLLLRTGSAYENREEALALQRGVMLSLPYIDTLLDGVACLSV